MSTMAARSASVASRMSRSIASSSATRRPPAARSRHSEDRPEEAPTDTDQDAREPGQDHEVGDRHPPGALQFPDDVVVPHAGADGPPAGAGRSKQAGEEEAENHKRDPGRQQV